ncbi:DUF4255 domain-containing protein [Thalassomonas viridans]|uniref:DUF4255 domain-containing protein n=1 Tax=Thalassomonas viridans TaxID=137584 RepID=A0AAF0C7Y6_9GAMM|nr:Pvc16 family protein [Thalassomonas viridans]WDE03645.1 DUF4255 domain-containing protein [Thalassomonas viridans]
MPVIASSLSQICRELADQLGIAINSGDDSEVTVMVGNPQDAVPSGSNSHRVNFFFYQFSPFEFDADALPGETGFMRVHCMITPFGVSEDSVGAGEHDLRILGEVIRIFQEQPVFSITVNGQAYHIQVIMQQMEVEQTSQLWGTQGDVVYRPSVSYEIALAPVVPNEAAVLSPLAGSLGLEIQSTLAQSEPEVTPVSPTVPVTEVNTGIESWQPRICLVVGGVCHESLAFEVGSPELAALSAAVWIAGDIGTQVDLRWDIWDATSGWETLPAFASPVIAHDTLDPDLAAGATTTAVTLPFTDQGGQAVLYAVRTYERAGDGVEITLLSNPVLVSLYE